MSGISDSLAAQERHRARRSGRLALLAMTAVWGSTFVVIKGAVTELLPGSLILFRFGLAGLILLPFLLHRARERSLWWAGLELGALNWAGYTSQAIGLTYTTASRSAFITALSVVLVPALAGLTGRRVPWTVQVAAALALGGVGLLSWDGQAPNRGDAWTLVTALVYAVYVLRLERHARRCDTRGLVLTQLWGVLPFAALWAVWEAAAAGRGQGTPSLAMLASAFASVPAEAWLAVIYLALAATALTTALQTYGQGRIGAPEAAIIYTSEPLWAALFAAGLLGERLGPMGWAGASAILLATWLGQRRS